MMYRLDYVRRDGFNSDRTDTYNNRGERAAFVNDTCKWL